MSTVWMNPLPTIFAPHGAPTFLLRPGAAGAALVRAGALLPRPRAVVMVSAHWETDIPTVGFSDRPVTIHDFWGFPEEIYAFRYPVTGCHEVAAEIAAGLRAAGFEVVADAKRGLDHGAWLPLHFMFPDADVPVIPLSIQAARGPEYHLRLGEALAPLMHAGYLLVASGNLTHNLRDYQLAVHRGGTALPYVREFADWVWQRLLADDVPALLEYRHRAPSARRAHPTEEHLLPLFVALGAAGTGARPRRLHAGIDDYVIAMDSFAFEPLGSSPAPLSD